jgi:hypothetical protein
VRSGLNILDSSVRRYLWLKAIPKCRVVPWRQSKALRSWGWVVGKNLRMNAAEVRNATGQLTRQSTQTEAALVSGLQN